MAAAQQQGEGQVKSMHQYKIPPPTYDGNHSQFEEWKYRFTAYAGLINSAFPRLLTTAETSQQAVTDQLLTDGASNATEAQLWVRLAAELQFILISTTKGAAATVCRQMGINANGFETWRQLHRRFSIPVGTRSIGYLTKLLKPSFDEHRFEGAFASWEFEVNRYERENTVNIPDSIKIAILLNETKGALQQHLQLTASNVRDYNAVREIIIEYYRTTASFTRMQQLQDYNPNSSSTGNNNQGPTPMDIGATYHSSWKGNKGKGKKGHHKGKGKHQGKGYYNTGYNKGKGKGGYQGGYPSGQGNPFKGASKGPPGKGKQPQQKGIKGKGKGKDGCYKCGQPGHIAKNCRVAIYHVEEEGYQGYQQDWNQDPTYDWYQDQWQDQGWYQDHQDWYGQEQQHTAQPAASPDPSGSQTAQAINTMMNIHAETVATINQIGQTSSSKNELFTGVDIMIDSGAATNVCPPWFGTMYPLHQMKQNDKPILRTVTGTDIWVYGYRWIHFINEQDRQIVIPFYVCDVNAPILSVSRLIRQGFEINLGERSTLKQQPHFESTITQKDALLYVHLRMTKMPNTHHLVVNREGTGKTTAVIRSKTIAPTTKAAESNPNIGGNDIWTRNDQGYIVRIHKRLRRALFTPYNSGCPVDIEQLEDYRKTIIRQPGRKEIIIEDDFQQKDKKQQNRFIQGSTWIGETRFKPRASGAPSVAPARTTTEEKGKEQQQQQTSRRLTGKQSERTTREEAREETSEGRVQTYIPPPDPTQKTTDYWIREGHLWKRVHVVPRTSFYCPEATANGPDIGNLLPQRTTLIKPLDGSRGKRIDDEWTTEPQPQQAQQWTGSTNFEEKPSFKEQLEEDEEENHQAIKARGVTTPKQPTEQEIIEHNLTHMPFRSWCPICVQGKGKADAHQHRTSNKPIIQIDFAYLKAFKEEAAAPVLTAIDIETGLCSATLVPNKATMMDYCVNNIIAFIMETGRTSATLQSDNEPYLKSLLQAVAAKVAGISTRHSPAYSSQSQGSIERAHRTLFGQVRVIREHLNIHYSIRVGTQHPIMPWIVKHSAFLINNYLIHSDGVSSYFRRWKTDNKTPICEFGESILYMPATAVKQYPKLENRFYKGIWLGKDTSSGESYIGIPGKVIKARTIRRQVKPWKYNRQLMDVINGAPWAPSPSTYNPKFILPSTQTTAPKETADKGITAEAETPATDDQTTVEEEQTTKKQRTATTTLPQAAEASASTTPTDVSIATPAAVPEGSPSSRRGLDDSITEGSSSKQQRTTEGQQEKERPEASPEPPRSKGRINAITVNLKNGQQVTTATCEDPNEARTEQRLLEPIIKDHQGFDPEKMKQGMIKEMTSMVKQGVFEEITIEEATEEEKRNIIGSKWVHRNKGDEVRSRIVGLGYDEVIKDADDIYASTPLFAILRVILCIALARGWSIKVGDISTAFLHASIGATSNILLKPPAEFYTNRNILWRLKKAMYGLRSSPKAWQDHLAAILQELGYIRLKSEPNVYKHPEGQAYIMVYVDDLLFVGETAEIDNIFKKIQEKMLLRPTGEASPGKTISFLGRKITNHGDRFDISLESDYMNNILEEMNLHNKCNPATTTGTTAGKENIEDEQLLDQQEHQQFRRLVGKLQWLAYTRPDISFATKELARALQQPTIKDQKKLRHLVRYLAGTTDYQFSIRPSVYLTKDSQQLDLNIYVDSDWAGCHQTRKGTTGFIIEFLGTCIHFGSRTQAVVALSSAEAEFYAIGTGAQEALYIKNFITEALSNKRINIRIHTDSSAGKSMATRQGVSKRAKHIELKFMFIQNLIQGGVVSLHKIPGKDNPADILTKYVTAEVLRWLIYSTGINPQ